MEIRNCLFCGKEFEAKSNKHKCCCKSHTDKYLRKQAGATYTERASLDDRNKRIIELAKSGLSCEEIKQELNLKLDCRSIYSILQKNGVKAKQKRERKKKECKKKAEDRNHERNAQIFELRKQGYSYKDIAEVFDMKKGSVAALCRDHGFGGVMSANDSRVRVKDQKEHVDKYLPDGYEYVSGYSGSDGILEIKCKKCDTVFNISMSWIRNINCKGISCPECKRKRKEEAEIHKKLEREKAEAERKARAEQRTAEKEAEREAKKRTVKCKICGKIFATYNSKQKCCSAECSKKYSNRLSTRRKDERVADDKRIDKDITALGLYLRDGGRCWICGGRCDTSDYIMRDGYKICGNNYPSVDHVVPVCEGGEDSWENVRLAHRICNTKRYFAEKITASCQ